MFKLVFSLLIMSITTLSFAGYPFADNKLLGVNYSVYFADNKNMQRDMELLKNCSYFKESEPTVIKLFDDTSLNDVLQYSDSKVLLGITNKELVSFAKNKGKASEWIDKHIAAFSSGRILAVVIGNEIFNADSSVYGKADEAMENVIEALKGKGLNNKVKVTFATCCSLTTEGQGKWQPEFHIVRSKYRPELQKLLALITSPDNESFIMINLYPHFPIIENRGQGHVANMLAEALFEKRGYENRFMIENMIENYRFAFAKINPKYRDIPLAIGEFGWPRDAVGINKDFLNANNSRRFLIGFKNWLSTSNKAIPSFIFEFKDEEGKKTAHTGGAQNGENRYGLYTDSNSPVDTLGLCN